MCTILVLHRIHAAHPLVVAANRDEIYDRSALSPRALPDAPGVIAGVDAARGGTWMGVHEAGLFVGVTNQRSWGIGARAPRSRGHVALDALRTGSREGVRRLLRELDPRDYESFNLIWGDASGVEVAYGRRNPAALTIEALPEGVHVLANDRIGSPHFPKSARAEALIRPHLGAPWPELVRGLHGALGDHAKPPLAEITPPPPAAAIPHELARELQAICIHTPSYGTRSSTILALDEGQVARYLFADGPPCTHSLSQVALRGSMEA